MKRILAAMMAGGSLCLWLALPVAVHGAEPGPPPLSAFGNVPAMRSVVLSPDGQQLAWIDNAAAHPAVEVFSLAKSARLRRINSPEGVKLRGLDWADDEMLLITSSVTHSPTLRQRDQDEWYRTLAINVRNGKSQVLLQSGGARAYDTDNTLLALRTAQPKKVLMTAWDWSETNYKQETGSRLKGGRKDSGWTHNLFEVDTTTGTGRMLSEGTPYTHAWIADGAGQAVVRSEWEVHRKRYTVWHRRGQGWTEIFRLDGGEQPKLLVQTQDGSAVLILGALGRERRAIWRLPLDGAAPEVLLEDSQYDMSSLVVDPYSRQPLGAWTGGPNPEIRWLDAKAEARSQGLRKTFGGKFANVIGRSADNSRVLVDVATYETPSIYYLIDYKKGTADIVGEEYPGLVEATLGKVSTVSYQTRDGYDIPAYLTLPPTVEPKQLALIVLPHGGPQARDNPGFDWMAQFFAARGYAVLQPQFRGSTGFGEAHSKAGYRQWGGLMQDDVTDGVKVMVEQGIADPRRVCIVGGSYGGYAALAGAAFTPELYACAVSINGVTDLPLMLGHERQWRGSESDEVAYWKEHIGSATDPLVIGKSPARNVKSIQAPILLLHGSDDTIVPIVQARVMAKALKEKGKRYTFIELPGEDHGLSRSESRIRVLTEMEKFLGEHLAAGKAVAGADASP